MSRSQNIHLHPRLKVQHKLSINRHIFIEGQKLY